MCGIVGIVYRDPARPVSRALMRAMCGSIRHRGPDDEGMYINGSAGLGARRLSIIDLASGHQPMVNEDESTAIAFNGEIYNYRELLPELESRGHRFRSHCDTEVVLHLSEEMGARTATRLRGMFAFATWNVRDRELILARDRFGIKPLYYTMQPWGIAFASELKALVQNGFTSRELDWDALDAYLEVGYIPAPATPFGDVRKLPPGHTLRWHDGGAVIEQYWDLPMPTPGVRAQPGQVRQWIDDAVASHLVSDVPVAAFLSGGLDSSTVVASMAAQHEPPHAFVAEYHGSGAARANETALARALAAHCGARVTVVDVRPQVESILEPIVYALDEPLADDSAIPSWTLAQVVGSQYKVALSGIGGDELFAGYRRHVGMIGAQAYRHVPAPLRRALSGAVHLMREPADGSGMTRVKRFLAGGDGTASERFLSMVSRLSGAERATLYAPDVRVHAVRGAAARAFGAFSRDVDADRALTAAQYLDYKTFLPDDVLALADRISMAHGLEVRVPLVDHELVERIFPLSPREKIGWGRPKHLLRRAEADRLPPELFRAPKRGFVGPTAAWLRNELRPMLSDELAPDRMRRLGYFSPSAVTTLLNEHVSRRRDREGILWALLCFSTWHRLVVEPASRPMQEQSA